MAHRMDITHLMLHTEPRLRGSALKLVTHPHDWSRVNAKRSLRRAVMAIDLQPGQGCTMEIAISGSVYLTLELVIDGKFGPLLNAQVRISDHESSADYRPPDVDIGKGDTWAQINRKIADGTVSDWNSARGDHDRYVLGPTDYARHMAGD